MQKGHMLLYSVQFWGSFSFPNNNLHRNENAQPRHHIALLSVLELRLFHVED